MMAAENKVRVEALGNEKSEGGGGNGGVSGGSRNRNGVPHIPINRPELDQLETKVLFSPTSSVKASHPPIVGPDKVRQAER